MEIDLRTSPVYGYMVPLPPPLKRRSEGKIVDITKKKQGPEKFDLYFCACVCNFSILLKKLRGRIEGKRHKAIKTFSFSSRSSRQEG